MLFVRIAFVATLLFAANSVAAQHGPAPTSLDCTMFQCDRVLEGAVRFERSSGAQHVTGYDAAGAVAGWVFFTTEIVDVPAYSGKPVVVLVGLTNEGIISGAHVVHHSEPILLAGIPESELTTFVDFYRGIRADQLVTVGGAARRGAVATVKRSVDDEVRETGFAAVDAISGATVTALAANRAVMSASREVAQRVGVVARDADRQGRFVAGEVPWTWRRMMDEGVLGHLRVTEQQMGLAGRGVFVDLWFTIADAPAIGRGLLAEGDYAHMMSRLQPGQHLLVVFGNGTSSFKGSAFVRGGIFDRVQLRQGLAEVQFRDVDYMNISRPAARDAPHFKEGAAFVVRDGHLDPGRPFELVFLGSRHDSRSAISREFRSFRASHALPASVYHVDEGAEEPALWVEAWRRRPFDIAALVVWLATIAGIFVARKKTFPNVKTVERLHYVTLAVSFVGVGLVLRAQPSVTQVLTLVGGLANGEFRHELFLSEPLIFILWCFIAVTSLVWGRGVFCGWLCAYGSLSELLFRLGRLLRLPEFELPDWLHKRVRYVRYGVLEVLVVSFLISPSVGELLAEVEPFKSTFYVPFWTRGVWFAFWWIALAFLSMTTFRPFCRYVCPLGAGLALGNTPRVSGPHRRNFCASCKICQRGCEPKAIRDDGTIDPRECLSCMECEATYNDREACPPLIGIDRLLAKKTRGPSDDTKLAELREQEKRRPWKIT